MIDEERYRKLKQEIEEAKSEADQARGALDQLLQRLQKEFNCKSLREAKELLETKQTELKKAEAAFNKALEAYEEKWGVALEVDRD